MIIDDLREAMLEAERFLKKAKAVRNIVQGAGQYSYSKETAACLRSSMDLTRSLSKLRSSK